MPAPQLRSLSSRWTRPPAGLAARATAVLRPRLRRAMAAPEARRPLLLLLLGEPGREGRREGRAGSASRDGREPGARPGGNGTPGPRASSGPRAGRPTPQWRSPPRSPCGPQDAGWLGVQPELLWKELGWSSCWAVLLALSCSVRGMGAASDPAWGALLTAVSQQRGGFRCSASICRTGERWLARSPGHLSRPVRPQYSATMTLWNLFFLFFFFFS